MAEREEVRFVGRPVVYVVGANALQVPFVVEALNAWGIEAYGATGARGFSLFAQIRQDVTHLLVLHGEKVVQGFRASLLVVQKHNLQSIEPVLELAGPECLRGIEAPVSTQQAA